MLLIYIVLFISQSLAQKDLEEDYDFELEIQQMMGTKTSILEATESDVIPIETNDTTIQPIHDAVQWIESRLSNKVFVADRHYVMRCTRRYSPGLCATSSVVVWSFNFQLQNCTERLGCPHASRSNRFATYRKCIYHCRTLIDVSMKLLALDMAPARLELHGLALNESKEHWPKNISLRQGILDPEITETEIAQIEKEDQESILKSADERRIVYEAYDMENDRDDALRDVTQPDIDEGDDVITKMAAECESDDESEDDDDGDGDRESDSDDYAK